jgi:hypothetical protein
MGCTEAVAFFAEVTGMSSPIVQEILTDLTFDLSNFHSSLMIQPFVKTRTNHWYVLPNIFAFVDPNRMLTGALNKGTKKQIYDCLINQIEHYHLEKLADLFKDLGMEVYVERTIKAKGTIMTPDLVIIDGHSRQVAILDYKHFLSPLGPSEVHYRIKETNKAIKQVSNYMGLIPGSRFMQEATRDELPTLHYTGIILFNTPIAIPLPIGLDLLITDLQSLKKLIVNKPDLEALMNAIRGLGKQLVDPGGYSLYDVVTEVDDWKIISQIYGSHQRVPPE